MRMFLHFRFPRSANFCSEFRGGAQTHLDAVQDKSISPHMSSKIFDLDYTLVLGKVDVCLEIDKIEEIKFEETNTSEPCGQ